MKRLLLIGTGGTGAAWSPLDMAGLVHWHDASAVTSLSNGDPVPQWDDLSGNAYHFEQGTAAKRPSFVTNVQNSLPAIRTDGSDDFLQINATYSSPVSQPLTVFMVMSGNGTNANRGYIFDGGTGGFDRCFVWATLPANDYTMQTNPNGFALPNFSQPPLSAGVFTFTFATGSSSARENGAQTDTGTVSNDPMERMIIGIDRTLSDHPQPTDYHEIILATNATAKEIDAAEAYLQAKWATPSLP